MLDLIISYINFLILSVSYIVKKFTFFPSDPPNYISIKTENENEENILFLIQKKNNVENYIKIEFRHLDYKFIKLIDKKNNSLPLLLFYHPSSISVCIIYSHGNSGDLGSCLLEYYDIAIHTNCLVLAFEYPGYGECKNQEVRESEFFKNLRIAYYFVKKILGFKSNQIILYGFSLGTGVMFNLACKKEFPAAGLILQSPFLSIMRALYNIKTTHYFDLFNNCDKAKNLCIKTFFIHGNKDEMVPYIHGRILAKLIPQKYFYDFLTVDNAGHNNLFKKNKKMIYKRIRQFIKDCTGKISDFIIEKEEKSKNSNYFKKNLKNEKNNINNNMDNKLNKSDELIKPSNNLKIINKNIILNTPPNFNDELRSLKNNRTNFYKNFYNNNNQVNFPIDNFININNFQNQNFPYNNYNIQLLNINNNNLNNFPYIGPKRQTFFKNNNIFYANDTENENFDNSTKILNTEDNLFNNSSINNI